LAQQVASQGVGYRIRPIERSNRLNPGSSQHRRCIPSRIRQRKHGPPGAQVFVELGGNLAVAVAVLQDQQGVHLKHLLQRLGVGHLRGELDVLGHAGSGRQAAQQIVMHGGAEAYAKACGADRARLVQLPQRSEQVARIARRGIDDPAVQQHARPGGVCTGRGRREPGKGLLVVAVLDHRHASGVLRKALGVQARRARRREDAACRLAYRAAFDLRVQIGVIAAEGLVGFDHRVAEVCDPGQAAATLQLGSDQVSGGDRVGAPDRVRAVLPDQLHAQADGVPLPCRPPVGPREGRRVTPEQRQVSTRVQRLRAAHDHAVRDRSAQVRARSFVRARMRRDDDRLPAVIAQVLHEPQRALDAAAAGQRGEVEGHHQHAPAAARAGSRG
jgi:hypothetical protein